MYVSAQVQALAQQTYLRARQMGVAEQHAMYMYQQTLLTARSQTPSAPTAPSPATSASQSTQQQIAAVAAASQVRLAFIFASCISTSDHLYNGICNKA